MSAFSTLLLVMLLMAVSPVAMAADHDLGTGLSVSAEHKLAKGLKVEAEAEVRTQDGLNSLERWSLDVGLTYKPQSSWLRMGIGYALMDRYHLSEVTGKGNLVNGYWGPRHRFYAGVTVLPDLGKRWKVSLRERIQLTHTPLQYVPKYNGTHCDCEHDHYGTRLTDEEAGGDQDILLRSRLQVGYNIRHCKFSPVVSVEFLNDLTSGFDLDQIRLGAGVDYSIDKRRSLSLEWRYKDRTDSDESNGHLFILGYNFSF